MAVDPAHTYLPFYNHGPSDRRTERSTTTVTLTQGGQTETADLHRHRELRVRLQGGDPRRHHRPDHLGCRDRRRRWPCRQGSKITAVPSGSGATGERRHRPEAPAEQSVRRGPALGRTSGPVDAAAEGSGPRVPGRRPPTSHRTTTKWRAPEPTRASTLSGSTPPVTHTGQGDRADGEGHVSGAGARAPRLGGGRHHRPGGQVVDRGRSDRRIVPRVARWRGRARRARGSTARRSRHRPAGPAPATAVHVVLADVDAVGAHRRGQVGPVVEDEGHPGSAHTRRTQARPGHQCGVVEVLLAELHDVHARPRCSDPRTRRGRVDRGCRGRGRPGVERSPAGGARLAGSAGSPRSGRPWPAPRPSSAA